MKHVEQQSLPFSSSTEDYSTHPWLSLATLDLNVDYPVLSRKQNMPLFPREKHIARAQIALKLDTLLTKKLAIVYAPAGYGKTSTVTEWITKRNIESSWISFDKNDNDIVVFSRYIFAALQALIPENDCVKAPLMPIPAFNNLDSNIARLLSQIEGLGNDCVLVFDDYHFISAHEIHNKLANLIDNLPSNLHIILISRSFPPFPIANLRVQQQLCEIDSLDLAFDDDEAKSFFEQEKDFVLSNNDIMHLNRKTEGWIAGLKLAALTMRGSADTGKLIDRLSGSNFYIADYLVQEVMQNLSEDIRNFIFRSSVLPRLCAEICNVLVYDSEKKVSNCQELLESIEHQGMFLFPLDEMRLWYRFHPLFSEMLVQRYKAEDPLAFKKSCRIASSWYEQHGCLREAVSILSSSKDYPQIIELIEHLRHKLFENGQWNTVLDLLEVLPEETISSRPKIQLAKAWALIPTGRYDEVELCLIAAEEIINRNANKQDADDVAIKSIQETWGEIEVIRAFIGLLQYDIDRMQESREIAMKLLSGSQQNLEGLLLLVLGVTHLIVGELQAAKETFSLISTLKVEGPLIKCLAQYYLAETFLAEGKLHSAAHLFEHVLDISEHLENKASAVYLSTCLSHISLADIFYRWNRLDDAERHARYGLRLSEYWNSDEISYRANTILSNINFCRRNNSDVITGRNISSRLWRANPKARPFNPTVSISYLNYFAANGNLNQEIKWAEMFAKSFIAAGASHWNAADYLVAESAIYLLVAAEKTKGIPELIQVTEDYFKQCGRKRQLIETLLAKTVFYMQHDNEEASLDVLAESLALAEPENYIRPFVDEGDMMLALLKKARTSGISSVFAERLIEAFPPSSTESRKLKTPVKYSLTERERQILTLLSDGLSVREIADELYIQQDTVRQHLKSCYSKLHVHSQAQAISKCQKLGLVKLDNSTN